MVCLITEICLLILGIITLVKGQINVSKDKMVVGAPARWIGAILLLPLPLSFSVGLCWGVLLAAQGRIPDRKDLQTIGAVIEISIFALCMVAVFIIALSSQKFPVKKPEKRRQPVEDEYEEDAYEDRRLPPPLPRDAIREENINQVDAAPEPNREPSPLRVQCTSCRRTVGIPEQALGKSVQCPLCSAVFVAQATPPPVHIQCNHCKKELSVPVSALGKSVKCPLCSEVFTAQLAPETGFTG